MIYILILKRHHEAHKLVPVVIFFLTKCLKHGRFLKTSLFKWYLELLVKNQLTHWRNPNASKDKARENLEGSQTPQKKSKKKKRKPTEHKNYSIILITNPASKNKME